VTLASAIDAFLRERRRLSASRRRQDRQALGLLLALAVSRRAAPGGAPAPGEVLEPLSSQLVAEDVDAVLDHERTRLTPPSFSNLASTLRLFCRFLVRKGLVLIDPARHVAVPWRRSPIGYVPSRHDVEKLLAKARERLGVDGPRDGGLEAALAQRDLSILELLYGSGLRLGEVRRLDVKDLDLRERTAFIRRGKGEKDRVVPLTKPSALELARYLETARSQLAQKGAQALFLTEKGHRLHTSAFGPALASLVLAAGLPRALTAHRLRHACAVHLLEGGADIVFISRLLGHASLRVTERYLALGTAEVRRTLMAYHPRERGSRGR
jgi:site-specific recombinase XerD